MSPEKPKPDPSLSYSGDTVHLPNLRGVRWRINLGILPSTSIYDLRRVTANSRRRYAGLRRRHLVDPHVPKEGHTSPDLTLDNPLSQNPDSNWSRFFRNAELEKMVDQDLSRLYPEHGSYFQTPGCQGLLRRILLLWCLRHPEYGYGQGMHELLAPLLYVLHVDIKYLSEVQTEYEDVFTDKFDGLSFQENDITYNFDLKKVLDSMGDEIGSKEISKKCRSLDELDPEIQNIVLLSDAYGAEGELGIVVSEKFLEHDAYCMFDSLMSGEQGSIAMADFFSPSPLVGSNSGLPPVIEASAALYQLLSVVDSSLHSHLVELGVEPQYFALRWLRVLYGREFPLQDLLTIWDEIFAADNSEIKRAADSDDSSGFKEFESPRGALISAIAVSMMLYMRSSLLATENATSCLQRLLNFPENADMKKLFKKAKSLQVLALDPKVSSSHAFFYGSYNHNTVKSVVGRSQSLTCDPISPKTPLSTLPDSYWEERWRVLHKAEESKLDNQEKEKSTKRKGWSEKVRWRLSRTGSDPSPARTKNGKKGAKVAVRRSLLEDLSRQLGLEEGTEKAGCNEASSEEDHSSVEDDVGERNDSQEECVCGVSELRSASGTVSDEGAVRTYSEQCHAPATTVSDEGAVRTYSEQCHAPATNDLENDSEKSSVASNIFIDENDDHLHNNPNDSPLPVSLPPYDSYATSARNNNSSVEQVVGPKEHKHGKFQWLWKFGRNAATGEIPEDAKSAYDGNRKSNATASSCADFSCDSSSSKEDAVDQNVLSTLKNLGNSMLEQIQVIESVFQQDRGQLENLSKNNLVGKGQVTAMTALKELRKISNLLSEM